jgi:hypothetical protein
MSELGAVTPGPTFSVAADWPIHAVQGMRAEHIFEPALASAPGPARLTAGR